MKLNMKLLRNCLSVNNIKNFAIMSPTYIDERVIRIMRFMNIEKQIIKVI